MSTFYLYDEQAELDAVYCDTCGIHHGGSCDDQQDWERSYCGDIEVGCILRPYADLGPVIEVKSVPGERVRFVFEHTTVGAFRRDSTIFADWSDAEESD